MSETIIHSKLHKPIVPHSFVVKAGLLESMSSAKVSIVSAQAGSGKSTAVSYWLDHQPHKFLWYSLDDWDNDYNLFLSFIGKGLLNIDDVLAHQIMQLTDLNYSSSEGSLNKTVVSLLHTISVSCVLVLDDYHAITEQKIHNFLSMLLMHLPSHLQLCVISREDPPLPIAKHRFGHQLYELRMPTLKFSLEEARKFFEVSWSKSLSNEQVAHLYQRSEGWVAGLQFMAMSLHSTEDIDQFLQGFTGNHHYIMDYLLEEVLERHTSDARLFLLKSSIVSYISPKLCEYVFEVQYSVALSQIDDLLRTNSFLIAFNTQKQLYRYHHLFRELLKQRLQRMETIDSKRLYRRAGEWFENQGEYLEAIAHYLEGEHNQEALALIEMRWSIMDMELRSLSWLNLAKRLPLKDLETSPILCLGYGWALLDQGDVIGCQPWFERAQELYDLFQLENGPSFIRVYDQEAFNNLPVTLLCAKAFIAAIEGNYGSLLQFTDKLSTLAIKHGYNRMWIIESFVAMMHWGQGDLNEALKVMSNLKEGSGREISASIRSTFTWIIAEILIQQGTLTKAQLMIEAAIEEVQKEKTAPVLVATYYLLLAKIETIRGERDRAYNLLEKSKSYGYLYEFMDWRYKYYLVLSRLYIQDQLVEKTKGCIQEGKQFPYLNPVPETLTLEDMSLWVALSAGNNEFQKRFLIDEALKGLEDLRLELPPYIEEMRWKIILFHAPIKDYSSRLGELCHSLLYRAKQQERNLHVIEYTLLASRFTKSGSQKANLMLNAKKLAEKEGIMQPFLEFAEIENKVYETLEPSFEVKRERVNQSLPEPLSIREMELLSLIAKGYSNQEICDTLFIALSTVKSYNNKLFGKLDVKRRTEAVAKAKTIGLIDY
ncbi:LuxR C-terminal-related transcriptional regulator [Paenibacillus koleovorans]|uniref:LuxR C-terminal-related transcriptional regulator n=1 Tax=Paenibacillus koleovorans TaxID=121608 RepID=UPI000FDC77EF|nr:LuxR C-terminal-related transcriptional regulator [Paenibacillus koleovorans]